MSDRLTNPAAEALVHVHGNGDRVELRGTSVQSVVNAALGLGEITVLVARPPEVAELIREGQEAAQTMNM